MPDTPLSLEGPYEGGPDAKALGPDLYVRPNSRLAAGPPRASCCTSLCLVPLLVNGNNNSVKPKGRACTYQVLFRSHILQSWGPER